MGRGFGVLLTGLLAAQCGLAAEYVGKDISVWTPEGLATVRAVIVHRHYGAGNQLYRKQAWRDFATCEGVAMALLIPASGKRKKDPVHPRQGTNDVRRLYAGLAAASRQLGIPSLAKAPFVTTGVSRGGANGIAMVYAAPERAVAAIGYHGESVIGSEQFSNGAHETVPVLYALASNDPKRNARVYTYVRETMRKRLGAPWTLIVQPDCRHNSTGDDRFVLPWLSTVLKLRLGGGKNLAPPTWQRSVWVDGTLEGPGTADASLGNPGIVNSSREDGTSAVPQTTFIWIPDSNIGRQWVEYHDRGPGTPESNQ